MSGRDAAGLDDFLEVVLADFRVWLACVVGLVVEALGDMLGATRPVIAVTLGWENALRARGVLVASGSIGAVAG